MSASIQCPPLHVHGRFFWQGDDRRPKFIIRGVIYQVRSTLDPISDDRLTELQDDILLFKELGLNTLFVYCIDNTKEHIQAMKLLEEAGIYVLTCVFTPSNAINRLAPDESYNPDAMASFFKTVDTMASFSNTLGLFAGNGLINNDATMRVAPVLKAVVRDLKKYMKLRNEADGQRELPIGCSAASSGARDKEVLDYLTAGNDGSSIDFWACNNYGSTDGYDDLLQRFRDTTIPMFFSEYGNTSHQPRLFEETTALYAPAMSRVFSGGCAYEFWQSTNGYGLVEMLEYGSNKRMPAYMQDPDAESKVAERRETDRGTLLIFNDFANYKMKLAEIDTIEAAPGSESIKEKDELGEANTGVSGPWQPGFSVPESCVDWRKMGGSVEM